MSCKISFLYFRISHLRVVAFTKSRLSISGSLVPHEGRGTYGPPAKFGTRKRLIWLASKFSLPKIERVKMKLRDKKIRT